MGTGIGRLTLNLTDHAVHLWRYDHLGDDEDGVDKCSGQAHRQLVYLRKKGVRLLRIGAYLNKRRVWRRRERRLNLKQCGSNELLTQRMTALFGSVPSSHIVHPIQLNQAN